MLTPYFELSQTDKDVNLTIKAPMANISDTELSVDEEVVIFYSSPYYLRIHLPGKVQSDPSPGLYDSDNGEFKFQLVKVNEGEFFPDLDLLGKLLNPKKSNVRPDIRLCSEVGESSESEEDDNEWLMVQEPFEPTALDGPKYGFADKFQGLTSQLKSEFFEILDITDNQCSDKREWSKQRENEENAKFSEDHYLADFMDPTPLKEILEYVSPYQTLLTIHKVELTPSEKDYLKNLGNRDYLLDGSEKRKALLSLVDILYSYAYNKRTTLGENTVESAWTINKLSSTLSCLESFNSIRDVKLSSIRRSLVYPLYRHWDLSIAVVGDTFSIMNLGRRQILKCLIEIHSLFNSSEPRYLLNQFYITDYCIWLQKVSDKTIGKLAEAYKQVHVCKADTGLDLEELERAAILVQEEELELIMAAELRKMALCQQGGDSSSNDSSTDSHEESAMSDNDYFFSDSESAHTDSDESSNEEGN